MPSRCIASVGSCRSPRDFAALECLEQGCSQLGGQGEHAQQAGRQKKRPRILVLPSTCHAVVRFSMYARINFNIIMRLTRAQIAAGTRARTAHAVAYACACVRTRTRARAPCTRDRPRTVRTRDLIKFFRPNLLPYLYNHTNALKPTGTTLPTEFFLYFLKIYRY